MAIPHAKPGEVVDVRPLGAALSAANSWTIVKTDALEVIRIVLPAGKEVTTGTAEIVQSERYPELLELARRRFRYVILDSAPMLRYADGVVIAHYVDGAVIVLSQSERKKSEVAEMIWLLQGLNTKVLGAVLSRS